MNKKILIVDDDKDVLETLGARLSGAGYTMGGNSGAVLAGTQAPGTLDTLKVIINPGAIYAIPYDMSSPITWDTPTDTTIPFACTTGEGAAGFGTPAALAGPLLVGLGS